MTTTTTRLRSISVAKLGLVYGMICLVIGVLVGLILGVFSALFTSVLAGAARPSASLFAIGWLGVIVFPLVYGIGLFIVGFIEGVIMGAVYNLVAGWTGGIELQLETAPTA